MQQPAKFIEAMELIEKETQKIEEEELRKNEK